MDGSRNCEVVPRKDAPLPSKSIKKAVPLPKNPPVGLVVAANLQDPELYLGWPGCLQSVRPPLLPPFHSESNKKLGESTSTK